MQPGRSSPAPPFPSTDAIEPDALPHSGAARNLAIAVGDGPCGGVAESGEPLAIPNPPAHLP
jgi:hypothetical protein